MYPSHAHATGLSGSLVGAGSSPVPTSYMEVYILVHRPLICFLAFLFLCATTFAQLPPGYQSAIQSITGEDILAHIRFLASDSLKGRSAGSPENDVAAQYIAAQFRRYGLKPLFPELPTVRPPEDTTLVTLFRANTEDREEGGRKHEAAKGSYLQPFAFKRTKLAETSTLTLTTEFGHGTSATTYDYKNDFLIQYRAAPRSFSATAPMLFVGYGIASGEGGYNDYRDSSGKELDVHQRIVVIVDGFPQDDDSTSAFSRSRRAYYRNVLRKAEVAAERGALAVFVVSSPLRTEPPFTVKYQQLSRSFERETDFLPERPSAGIPVFYLGPTVTNDLFRAKGLLLDSLLLRIHRSLTPCAFEFAHTRAAFDIRVVSEVLTAFNVVGLVEGTDSVLRHEAIVVGAHFDHVGFGYRGAMNKKDIGKIHYGADDNASGTAALLEIARALAQVPPRRSVVCVAFSGEENGLLGSRYYVNQQPLWPLAQTVAMLNCDMVGRNEPKLLWIGGAFYGDDLRQVIERANSLTGFELLYNVGMLTSASDQSPFLRKKIPSAFFFCGLHDDYHTPNDVPEKIDPDKTQRVATLAYLTAWTLANQLPKPAYRELTVEERTRLIKDSQQRQHKIRPPEPK